jgi:hypothetical protein
MSYPIFYRILERSDGRESEFDVFRVQARPRWLRRDHEIEVFLKSFPTAEKAKAFVRKQEGDSEKRVVNYVGDFLPNGREINVTCGW